MSLLQSIVRHKKEEIAFRKTQVSISHLMSQSQFERGCHSLTEALTRADMPGVIAEFKRKSPSLPELNPNGSCEAICKGYQTAGAAAVSILTDHAYFGGADEDVLSVHPQLDIPILRKEFIIDPYQVVESKSIGADVILLIASILSRDEAQSLANIASECGLEVILEIHSREEIGHWHESMHCIGVNNRNLSTFTTDVGLSRQLFPFLPSDSIKIAESGLHSPSVVRDLFEQGYKGFLMGEYFLKQSSPQQALSTFLLNVNASVC